MLKKLFDMFMPKKHDYQRILVYSKKIEQNVIWKDLVNKSVPSEEPLYKWHSNKNEDLYLNIYYGYKPGCDIDLAFMYIMACSSTGPISMSFTDIGKNFLWSVFIKQNNLGGLTTINISTFIKDIIREAIYYRDGR